MVDADILLVVGVSSTEEIVTVTVAILLSSSPSLALKVKESVPLKLVFGVYVTSLLVVNVAVPFEPELTIDQV